MSVVIQGLSKRIRGVEVLKDVSLSVDPGRVVGLAGPNGSGKTMLMRCVAGLISPTSGTVEIDGKVLGRDIAFPPSIGLLIESPAFLAGRSGFENLRLLASIRGTTKDDQVRHMIGLVGLDPGDKRPVRKYSLGMKQRLGIAAAVMESPGIVILDEPTNALDASGVEMVKQVVAAQKARGAAVLLSCHDSETLCCMADEIFFFAEGHMDGHEDLAERGRAA